MTDTLFIRRRLFSVDALIDRGDFLDPSPPIGVLEIQDRLGRPVKVISHEGYLLVQRLEGVAYNPPAALNSISNECSHLGQSASTSGLPFRLIWL